MNYILTKVSKFAHREGDSADVAFSKLLILIVALACCCCGIIWAALYYTIFGFGLTMILPLVFVVVVGGIIIVSHLLADHRPLIYTQLICITWISALIQWSIGSLENSGIVIAWCFLGPLGALIFLNIREALIWMAMFIAIVVVSAVIEPSLLGQPLEVSDNVKALFFVMNMGAASAVVFAASAWFVSTIQFEHNRAEKLLVKIKTLFGQHVSDAVAEKLIADDNDQPASKSQTVTVMFLDIRDFTKLADSIDPQELAKFQNIVFSELINIVRINKGIVNQLLGDGIMAIFGAPVDNQSHVNDGVNAGMTMIETMKELSEQSKIPDIRLGIGLHTGSVIAGELGNEFRKQYSLTGTNVIIASRIEQLNKELNSQFLVSEAVFESIEKGHSATFRGKISLKGISEPVGIYQLL